MDEISIGDKIYLSSKKAAKVTGYAKDYIGQLCREGRVEAKLVGRNWYVLESAIKEHRFGKQEEPAKESHTPQNTDSDVVKTWQKPQYEALAPVTVPELSSRRENLESQESKAVSDMQSAWREWFQGRSPEPTVVSDEEIRSQVSITETTLESVEDKPQEVQLSRIVEDSGEIEEVRAGEQIVPIKRSYSSMETGEQLPARDVPPVDLSKLRNKPVRGRNGTRKGGSSMVARSILVVVALMIALLALIGTGYANLLFRGSTPNIGITSYITDFLSGTSRVEK